GALQRAVLPRPAVAAVDRRVDVEGLVALAEEAAARRGDEPDGRCLAGHAVGEVGTLEAGVDLEPVAGLGPEHAHRLTAGGGEGARRLQAGEDADVVLGRRPAEDHGRLGHEVPLWVTGCNGLAEMVYG